MRHSCDGMDVETHLIRITNTTNVGSLGSKVDRLQDIHHFDTHIQDPNSVISVIISKVSNGMKGSSMSSPWILYEEQSHQYSYILLIDAPGMILSLPIWAKGEKLQISDAAEFNISKKTWHQILHALEYIKEIENDN
jgi:hypothetical protein